MTELSPAHEARLEAFKEHGLLRGNGEYDGMVDWMAAVGDYEKLLGELAAAQARGEYAWELAQSMIPPEALTEAEKRAEAAEQEVARLKDAIRLALEPYPPPPGSEATEAWAIEVQRRRQALLEVVSR